MTDLNKEDGGGVFGGIFSPMFDSDVQREAEEMLGTVERTMRSGETQAPREPLLIERLVAELPEVARLLARGAKRKLRELFGKSERQHPTYTKRSISVSPNLGNGLTKPRTGSPPTLVDVPPIGSIVDVRVQEKLIQAKIVGYGGPAPHGEILVHFDANNHTWLEAPSSAIIRH